ncbi:MAG: insulinase family protein [Candidatus Thermofonsia Clade 1 bacterium]|jgi:zinc protease|uniref:Insulinase family protein n=1 Tax=Candidatus Thermofonsia Clade 1 bacterium TaxID=2364210 RepID=A0A2M8PDP3_9CHLR|nr:MAG: insulinase family protein [Candidatus Thermofonsia Clade 1 bacterium]PJF43019.1 MAG: insulinase family protein [Candidatus Thermofonsia Clade 1 bacterium]RMF49621.1 MAG: insulinase family protein [Chloroflexota bacterium]
MTLNSESNVSRHVLPNGLIVLLKEVHKTPIISFWVLYRVGSRDEPSGKTGISHWVEHMMFKGTPNFPAGVLDKAIDREGGTWNAQTSLDYTAYFETMPADRIDLALRAEADRMINAQFAPEEVESERTVIISERQGLENDPSFWLDEEVQAAAFRVHGYHHEVIGDMADLERMTRDDLYAHYRTYYAPNNAILSVVGDFESAAMLARLEALFGLIPPAQLPRPFLRPEPPQQGERRVRVERPGPAPLLSVAYKAPAVTHPDWIKLFVLDSILGGASGFGGGSLGNKTSRLYQALVKTELAASASSALHPTADPYLYSFDLTLREGRTLEEAEAALEAELQKAINGEITQAELDKARKQARALFAYSTERVTSQAFWLAYFEHVAGSYEFFLTFEERLRAVTLEDIQAVAQRYLRPQSRTVGWFVPTPASEGETDSAAQESLDELQEEIVDGD